MGIDNEEGEDAHAAEGEGVVLLREIIRGIRFPRVHVKMERSIMSAMHLLPNGHTHKLRGERRSAAELSDWHAYCNVRVILEGPYREQDGPITARLLP